VRHQQCSGRFKQKNSPVVFTTGLLILDRLKIEVELL